MRIAYVVSRFPLASETFVVRELNGVHGHAAPGGESFEVELLSLFPAGRPFVHPEARPWVGRARRPSTGEALAATAWWLPRAGGRLARAVVEVAWAHRRSPRHLARALATLPLAAAHARHVRAAGIHHLHAHFATYPALTAWLCRRLTGVGYSFTAHAHDLYVDASMLPALVAEASFVVTISDFNRRFIAERAGGAATPVEVVHCGVRPAGYAAHQRALPATGTVRALCVASLSEYKGHRVLLQALHDDRRLDRLHVDLVGGGELEDELRALAQRLGVADRVAFLGPKDEGEVARLLADADLFVLPSLVARDGQMEGLPVALMEALAAGLPTVSTRLSGIPELVRDGETGALAEPGDPVSLAGALARVLSDPEGAAAQARAGRELVVREFDVDRSAARMRELIAAAISART